MSPSTTRWSPTPEQLMILEEMYKGGLRTPNATQIQKITSHLSFYGKIEGKNVFYWFQNHKARDRQKLRKKLILTKQQQLQFQHKYFSPNSNIIINNYPPSSDDAVLSLIDPPPPPPPPAVAALHLHALHHQYDRYAEYLRLQGGSDDDGGTARLTNDGGNGGDDDWMMTTTTTTKKTVSSSSMTSDLQAPVGPTCTLPCCTSTTNYYYYNNNNRPLKTLELFPVTSPSLAKDHQINTNGANTNLFLHKN